MDRAAKVRDGFMSCLEQAGIGSRPGTHSPPLTVFYRERYGYGPEELPAGRAGRAIRAWPCPYIRGSPRRTSIT